LTLRDKASRGEDIPGGSGGHKESLEKMEELLKAVLDPEAAVAR
jgi:hypothetical protein